MTRRNSSQPFDFILCCFNPSSFWVFLLLLLFSLPYAFSSFIIHHVSSLNVPNTLVHVLDDEMLFGGEGSGYS